MRSTFPETGIEENSESGELSDLIGLVKQLKLSEDLAGNGRKGIDERSLKNWLKSFDYNVIRSIIEKVAKQKKIENYAAYVNKLLSDGSAERNRNSEINQAWFERYMANPDLALAAKHLEKQKKCLVCPWSRREIMFSLKHDAFILAFTEVVEAYFEHVLETERST